jgi:hypothetical protein
MTDQEVQKQYINIEIQEDRVAFNTNLPLAEMNFWLDHIKNLIITGQAQAVEEK